MGVGRSGNQLERLAGPLLCLLALSLSLLAGCEKLTQINAEAYRAYHASRWQAVAEAYAVYAQSAQFPLQPPVPAVCSADVDQRYALIVTAGVQEDSAYLDLTAQGADTVQFVSELLEIMARRDVNNLEKYTRRISEYDELLAAALERWIEARRGVAERVGLLEEAWTEAWPQQDLDFDLLAAVRQVRQRAVTSLTDVRSEALGNYHRNEYDRLAMTYLDYVPSRVPHPKSHVPQGCDELAASLQRLEQALDVRYSMDQAIEADVTLIQELAKVDLSDTPWERIEVPAWRYGAQRVAAALARLKVLKYVDELLTDALNVQALDVERQWELTWPGSGLEVNIFAHAQLEPAPPDWPDPLNDWSFRQ